MERMNKVGELRSQRGAIGRTTEYYEGMQPRDAFPEYAKVIYQKGWTGGIETVVSWQTVRPIAEVVVNDKK